MKKSYQSRDFSPGRESSAEKVSVIVPVYNAERYIDNTIKSILTQSHQNIEILIVDDGSTDNSLLICVKYAVNDKRVNIIKQSNHGVSRARNIGIEASSGNYIMFVDSDDEMMPGAVRSLLDSAHATGADVVTGNVTLNLDNIVDRVGAPAKHKQIFSNYSGIKHFLSSNRHAGAWARLYTAEIVKGVRFEENISINEDRLFVFEVLKNADRSTVLDIDVYYYRQSEASTMRSGFNANYFDFETTADMIYKSAIDTYPNLLNEIKTFRFVLLMILLDQMALQKADRQYPKKYSNIRKRILLDVSGITLGVTDRLKIRLLKSFPFAYPPLLRAYGRLLNIKYKVTF